MKIEGCFNGDLNGFQECLKEVQWVFEGSFHGVSRIFQGSLKGVSRMIVGCSERPLSVSKKAQGVFQGSFKNVLSKL